MSSEGDQCKGVGTVLVELADGGGGVAGERTVG